MEFSCRARAGAWIETFEFCYFRLFFPSRPARARGLKHFAMLITRHDIVAPRAGAWIETCQELGDESQIIPSRPRGRVDAVHQT